MINVCSACTRAARSFIIVVVVVVFCMGTVLEGQYSDIGSNMFRFGMNAACIVRSVMLSVSGVG